MTLSTSLIFISVSNAIPYEQPKKIATYVKGATRLENEILNIEKYLAEHQEYNQQFAFFLDMRLPSQKRRFFVFDYEHCTILDNGMVAHGLGSEIKGQNELLFSNMPNSNSTSLGKYVIEKSYIGKFGKAYRLTGLDSTNNNAIKRAIVLHKYKDVPYDEQYYPICLSLGCPMVNEKFFSRLEQYIDNSKKKIILYIYY